MVPSERHIWSRDAAGAVALIALLLLLPLAYLSETNSITGLGNLLLIGMANGAIWALIASGYTLVYGTLGLINFAHGDVFMIGSVASVGLFADLGLSTGTSPIALAGGLLLVMILAGFAVGSLNLMIERVGFRPLRESPKLAALITAVGFAFILENVALLWIGGNPHSVPDLIGTQKPLLELGGITLTRGMALTFAASAPILAGLMLLMARTRVGKAMRATAQDREAARLMGINPDYTIGLVFFITGLVAGAAGLIWVLYQTNVWYHQGFQAGLIGFTAAVLGGIGNLRGAVVGGLAIGCIQAIADNRLGPEWTPVVVFGYLIVILTFRPVGLFGEQVPDR
jgi:branched-chain amino acid transport system permease protein